jgi:hypothetical protein
MPLVQHNQSEPPFRDLLALDTLPPRNPPATDNAPALRPGPEREAMLRKAPLVERPPRISMNGWHRSACGPRARS